MNKRLKHIEFRNHILYLMLIIQMIIQPICMNLTYSGIYVSIKKAGIMSTLLISYCIISIIINYKKKVQYFKLPIFILIVILLISIFSYTYVKEFYCLLRFTNGSRAIMPGKQLYFELIKDRILYYIVFSIWGYNIEEMYKYFKKAKIVKLNKILYSSIIASFIFISITNKVGITNVLFSGGTDSAFYLYIGDYFALFCILIFESIKHKTLFCINNLFWIYKIGSRTSLLCYILYICFIVFRSLIYLNINTKKIVINVCIFSLVLLGGISIFQDKFELDNRMISVFSDNEIEQDGSYLERKEINDDNLKDLKNIWFTGRVLREVEIFNSRGHYSHNILSYWIEFGIIPFALILYSILIMVIVSIKAILRKNDSFLFVVVSLVVFLLPEILFSRSYAYPYVWLIIFSVNVLRKYIINSKSISSIQSYS